MINPHYVCTKICYGVEGQSGACCTLGERDWIIGPHDDTQAFVDRLSARDGKQWKVEDVFIDFEEGSKLFPDRPVWQDPANYPAMRVEMRDNFPCQFLKDGQCSVYDIRANLCRSYQCDFLKAALSITEIKTL